MSRRDDDPADAALAVATRWGQRLGVDRGEFVGEAWMRARSTPPGLRCRAASLAIIDMLRRESGSRRRVSTEPLSEEPKARPLPEGARLDVLASVERLAGLLGERVAGAWALTAGGLSLVEAGAVLGVRPETVSRWRSEARRALEGA